jgi:hypothetical protein
MQQGKKLSNAECMGIQVMHVVVNTVNPKFDKSKPVGKKNRE